MQVISQEDTMNSSLRLDSDYLIHMKDLSGLTIEAIAEGTGVPLGTAQKIFSGITKTPRSATAVLLYSFLLPYVEKRRLQAEETVAGYVPPSDGSGISFKTPETKYQTGKGPGSGPWISPRDFIEGNLARNMRQPGSYTTEDYYALPDDRRAELIDGFFYDMASPSTVHQRLSGILFSSFFNYIRENDGSCEVFAAPFDVQLDEDDRTMVQPDLVVICDPGKVKDWGIFGAPDLVVEILSPSTKRKDRTLKMTKYGDAGVREYWIVDPEKERTTVCRFEEEMPVSFYPFTAEIPVGIYGGELRIRLK